MMLTSELKTDSKRAIQNQQKHLVIWLAIKLLVIIKKSSTTSPQDSSETNEKGYIGFDRDI